MVMIYEMWSNDIVIDLVCFNLPYSRLNQSIFSSFSLSSVRTKSLEYALT